MHYDRSVFGFHRFIQTRFVCLIYTLQTAKETNYNVSKGWHFIYLKFLDRVRADLKLVKTGDRHFVR